MKLLYLTFVTAVILSCQPKPRQFDLIVRNKLGDHKLEKGDKIIFASVGAGMHINAMVYPVSYTHLTLPTNREV